MVSDLWFLCTALFHNVFYQIMKFQVDSYKRNKKKIRMAQLWFLRIAIINYVFYQFSKFQNDGFYSLKLWPEKKIKGLKVLKVALMERP